MSRRLIRYIGLKTGLYPWLSLVLVLILTVFAALVIRQNLRIEMDVATLLPRDSDLARDSRQLEWDFGRHDFLLSVIEIREDAPEDIQKSPRDFLLKIQKDLETALDDQRFFRPKGPEWRQDPSGDDISAVSLARLTETELTIIENSIMPERLETTFQALSTAFKAAKNEQEFESIRKDPFGVVAAMQPYQQVYGGPLRPQNEGNSYLSEDGRMMLLVLWPTRPSTDLIAARDLRRFISETRTALFSRHPTWRSNVTIDFIGPNVENSNEETDVVQDILSTSTVSFIAVMLLFVVAFRQPEAVLFVAIPLVVGLLWTLAAASVIVERITQVTLIFAAIMIGLGIDFSIHLYSRFVEDLRSGRHTMDALKSAMNHTGPSIVAGAITTGIAFYGMTITRFEGFRELGIFGALGIALCLLAMVATLPPLMIIFAKIAGRMRGPMATLGLKKVTFTVRAYPRMTVAAGLCIVAYLGLYATKTRFNEDFETLGRPTEEYGVLIEKVAQKFPIPGNPIMVVLEGPDLEDVLRQNDKLFRNIQNTTYGEDIVAVDSLRMIFPSKESQRDSLRRFSTINPDTIEASVRQFLEANPEIPADLFDADIAKLRRLTEQARLALGSEDQPITLALSTNESFEKALWHHVNHDRQRDVMRVLTRIYPRKGSEVEGIPEPFLEQLKRNMPNPPRIIGNDVLSSELQRIILMDLARIVLVVLTAVMGYLLFYFRSIGKTLLSMIPVAFSMICLVGMIYLLGMQLNYLNIIAIPMIIGISVDSSIHFLGRYVESGSGHGNLNKAIEKTGRAIMITGLTTIFGFGSLCVASFEGVREIGILVIVGTVATLFATLVFLPAVIQMLDPKLTFRGGVGDEIG